MNTFNAALNRIEFDRVHVRNLEADQISTSSTQIHLSTSAEVDVKTLTNCSQPRTCLLTVIDIDDASIHGFAIGFIHGIDGLVACTQLGGPINLTSSSGKLLVEYAGSRNILVRVLIF